MSVNSTNVQTQVNKSNFGAELGTSIAFSGIMSGGFGSITAVKNHKKDVFKVTKANSQVLKAYADKIAPTHDTFTKNLKVSYNYQDYTRLAKQTAKANRKLEKLKNATQLPFFEKIKNLFRKKENKLDLDGYKTKLRNIGKTFDEAQDKLKAGKSISNEVLSHLDNVNDIKKATKGLFKSELKDPFGLFFAGTEMVSRFTTQALPAFKNEGFIAGLKETGKAIAAGGMTLVADAGLSVVFRSLGATVGGFLGPLGASIGSMVGNAIGGMVSNTLVQKIFPAKEQAQELASEAPQEIQQAQPQIAQQVQTQAATNPIQQQDLTAKYANMPSKDQVKRMAYAQAFQGKGDRFNTYYA